MGARASACNLQSVLFTEQGSRRALISPLLTTDADSTILDKDGSWAHYVVLAIIIWPACCGDELTQRTCEQGALGAGSRLAVLVGVNDPSRCTQAAADGEAARPRAGGDIMESCDDRQNTELPRFNGLSDFAKRPGNIQTD